MVTLGTRVFRGKAEQAAYEKSFGGRYMKLLKRNHFLYFGLPFLALIVAGLIYLQNFTQVKWDRYDDKYRQMEEDDMLGMIKNRKTVDRKSAYYKLQAYAQQYESETKASDDYEMVRVKRRPEDEPVWDKPGSR